MALPHPWNGVKDPLVLPQGYLRTEVAIYAPPTRGAQDAAGGAVEAWSKVFSAFAAVETIAETQVYQSGEFGDQVTHRVVMRWPGAVVQSGMRVVTPCDGQTFEVHSTVNVRKSNRVLWILCVEVDGGMPGIGGG